MTKSTLFWGLFLALAACSNDSMITPETKEAPASESEEITEISDALINACLKKGLSRESCECSVQASADNLSKRDFIEHSELQLNSNQAGLDEFLRRKYAEDRDTMFNLGEALGECPGSLIPAELRR